MKKIWPICIVTLLACSCPADGLSQDELNKKIDSALYYYYNGKTFEAKKIAQSLRDANPRDPFFCELLAEIIWQELDKAVAPGQPKDKKINYAEMHKNRHLVEHFYEEIYSGLVFTQEELNRNPQDPKNVFLRGMLLTRLGGFIAKFENGLKSYSDADQKTAEGIRLLQKSIALDPQLCSVKAMLALAKYSIIQGANQSVFNKFIIRWKSEIFEALGSNFDIATVFSWLDESLSCNPDYYWTKDVNIDKKLIYQDILVKQAGRMDAKALPILIDLRSRFPDNTVIRDNLFLVRLHLKR